MSTTQSSAENSPQNLRAGLSFPPLMAAMDTYMDVKLDGVHSQLGGHGKAAGGKKKKTKKNGVAKGKVKSPIALPKTPPRKESIVTTPVRQILSPRSPNNADSSDRPRGEGPRLIMDDDDKDNFSLQEMHSPSFPSPPPGGGIQKSGSFASRSAPRGGRLYRENPDIPVSPVSRPTSSMVVRPEASFHKALQSIAALKVHNYAVRRRQQQQRKLQQWRDLKSLHRLSHEPLKPSPKHQLYEAIAAWKLRYFVEHIRLCASRKEARALVEASREKDREAQALSQLIDATHGEIGHIVAHQRAQQEEIVQTRGEVTALQQDVSSLHTQLDEAHRQLDERDRTCAQHAYALEEERRLRAVQAREMDLQAKELELTRLTCQELIRKSLSAETDLRHCGVQMHTHTVAYSTLVQQHDALTDAYRMLSEQVQCLQEDLPQRWNQRLEAQRQSADTLCTQLQRVTADLHVEQQAHEAARQRCEQVEQEVEQVEQEQAALRRLTADLAVQLEAARHDGREAHRQLDTLQASLHELRSAHAHREHDMTVHIQQLDESLVRTQTSLQAAVTAEQTATQRLEHLSAQWHDLQLRYQDLETDHLAVKNAFIDLHKRMLGGTAATGSPSGLSAGLPLPVQRMLEASAQEQQAQREQEIVHLRNRLAAEEAARLAAEAAHLADRTAREVEREHALTERRRLEDTLLALMAKIEDKVDHFESLHQTWLASPGAVVHSPLPQTHIADSSPTMPPPESRAEDTPGPSTARTSLSSLSRPHSPAAAGQDKQRFVDDHLQLENVFHDLQLQLALLRDEMAQEEHNLALLDAEQRQYREALDSYFKEFEEAYQRPITEADWDENTWAYRAEIDAIEEDMATRRANNAVREENIRDLARQARDLNADLEGNADAFLRRYGEPLVAYYPPDLLASLEKLPVRVRRCTLRPEAAEGGGGAGGKKARGDRGGKKGRKKKRPASFAAQGGAARGEAGGGAGEAGGARAQSAPQAAGDGRRGLAAVEEAGEAGGDPPRPSGGGPAQEAQGRGLGEKEGEGGG